MGSLLWHISQNCTIQKFGFSAADPVINYRYARSSGLDVDDASMSNVIGAIKAKGLVSGAQKSMLATMLQMRNQAMHAKWDKIQKPEVSSLIAFVEQFLLNNFSRSR